MKDVLPFLVAHWPLTLAFLVTLVAIVFYELTGRQSGSQRVNCTELTRLMNHEKAVVVDVRQASDFAKGHIVGAMNIQPDSFKDHQVRLRKMSNRPFIVVDQNGSGVGAMLKLLKEEGLNAFSLVGGLNAWRQESMPLTTLDN